MVNIFQPHLWLFLAQRDATGEDGGDQGSVDCVTLCSATLQKLAAPTPELELVDDLTSSWPLSPARAVSADNTQPHRRRVTFRGVRRKSSCQQSAEVSCKVRNKGHFSY